jgi:hypothetical protein
MITESLFNKILVEPALVCNQLKIISGYASPAMANKHIASLPGNVSVNLLVGMVSSDGMGRGGHNGFCALDREQARFKCNYIITLPAVHSKSYIWLRNGVPQLAFTGSGNYSQNAFFGGTRESFGIDDPVECNNFYESCLADSISCLQPNIEEKIKLYDEIYRRNNLKNIEELPVTENEAPAIAKAEDTVNLSLLSSKDGQTHNQSGLNWGQRPGREQNQAYIPIPSVIAQSGFFPHRANHFTLITDDGQSFDCAVAQDGDKAIHTTKSNSILGRYFRHRLGVPPGDFVTKEHLLKYGRTDVSISKIDDETYFMNFSATSPK